MKKKIILFCLIISSLSISCKEEAKTQNKKEVENTEDYFKLEIEAIIAEDDTFIMYYLANDMKAITKKKSVSVNSNGNKSAQTLKFHLNEKVLPEKLFIKYKNKSQKIQFLSTSLTYEGKEFKFDGERFFQFFIPNQSIDYDRTTATATSKDIGEKFNPTFSSRKVLEEKIDYNLYQ